MNRWAADIEKVVRSLLTYVRRKGQEGDWVPAKDAFKIAIEEHRTLEWVRYIEVKPRAKIAVTGVIKRLMKNEFLDIERAKPRKYRAAPVFFRVRGPSAKTP